jgi:hypothetical protein
MEASDYFLSYFETFGKRDGLRFWKGLLEVLPNPDKKKELIDLYVTLFLFPFFNSIAQSCHLY